MTITISGTYFKTCSTLNSQIISLLNKCSVCSTITRYSCRSFKMFDDQNILTVNRNPHSSIVIPSHMPVRTKSYYKHKYDKKLEAAVNNQIQAEEQAAQDYLNMAVAFLHPSLSRPGAGGFFMRMFDEEIGHMHDFIQYQLLRGGRPLICGLQAPKPNTCITLLEAFQRALVMERAITELLEDVVRAAESVKDYQCADFVTSVFLEEQMRSLNVMAHHVTKLTRLCDEHSIYHYDLELAKKYPWEYKRKVPE